jgi:hypothetical protein
LLKSFDRRALSTTQRFIVIAATDPRAESSDLPFVNQRRKRRKQCAERMQRLPPGISKPYEPPSISNQCAGLESSKPEPIEIQRSLCFRIRSQQNLKSHVQSKLADLLRANTSTQSIGAFNQNEVDPSRMQLPSAANACQASTDDDDRFRFH